MSVSPPLFFFLALSGFARFGLGVLVCVLSLPLLLRSPLRVWLSNFHLIFMFISPSSLPRHPHLHFIFLGTVLPKAGCVCGTSVQT